MLRLEEIALFQFKNYTSKVIHMDYPIIAFTGKNGIGKTNILEAIYYLCLTKSYFRYQDQSNIMMGHDGFRISGTLKLNDSSHKVKIIFKEKGRKQVMHNDNIVKKHIDYIGQFPVVMIVPDDIELVNGLASLRRKYLDGLLSQINSHYCNALLHYQKILQNKQHILKQWKVQPDTILLETYNAQLKPLAEFIYKTRKDIFKYLKNAIYKYYTLISGSGTDHLEVTYKSQFNKMSWEECLGHYCAKEIMLQQAIVGIHKDDLVFLMDNDTFKYRASQGQKKTLLFALKLAKYKIMQNYKAYNPLLLLDDIFEKLDDHRILALINIITSFPHYQIIMTDVNSLRLREKIEQVTYDYKIYEL